MNPTTANIARIDDWLDALAAETDTARHSAAFTAYLTAMSRFWRYSQYNSLLIFSQRPTATHVNSRKRWEALGYTVKTEAWRNSIQILCPHFKKVRDEVTGDEKEILTHFNTGYIYDRADMDAGPTAQPLDAPWATLAGDHDALYALLRATCRLIHISVDEVATLPPQVEGASNGRGGIVLNDRASVGNKAQTLLHELAHELVHPSAVRGRFTTQEVECQAEAIAYCVSQALGMETPNSPTYLALYHIGREELKKNAQAIALGVQRILREVERASAQAAEVAA